MIIYTPRNYNNDIMMAEEPIYRRTLRRRENPIDSLFRSMTEFEPFRPVRRVQTPVRRVQRPVRRVERPARRVERPVRRRRTFFDDFFGDVFNTDSIFDNMFPTIRRTQPAEQDQSEEDKENINPEGEIEEAEAPEADEVERHFFTRQVSEKITKDENGDLVKEKIEKVNNDGKVKETEAKIIEDEETGEIKEEEYHLNGEKVDKMALESEDSTEDHDEDDGWVIKPVEHKPEEKKD